MPRSNPHAFDEDNAELTDEQLSTMKPASAVFSPDQLAALTIRRPGRPPKPHRKVEIKLRIDPDVLEAFKAGGPGWQTRMHDALRRAAEAK